MKLLLSLVLTVAIGLQCFASKLPSRPVPEGLGVCFNFTGGQTSDMDMIKSAGFGFVRTDIHWAWIEKSKGEYDFHICDQLIEGLSKRGLRALIILDYSNKLYEIGKSIRTEEGRQAFARFVAAAATRYKGKGVTWELWNEPNLKRNWEPQADAGEYMALARVAIPAIRKADPDAACIAPATSGVPQDFLEACFKQGLLDLVDGVSIHPYLGFGTFNKPPEMLFDNENIRKLKALIAGYSSGTCPPIVASEWGYSDIWKGGDEELQGQYVARELLTAMGLGFPLVAWYDWHDDGTNPTNGEYHFGIITYDRNPKPAYAAVKRLTDALQGMRFIRRLESAPGDYLLLFGNGGAQTLAAWTSDVMHPVEVSGKRLLLSGDPQYVSITTDK
jgi:polysaccharide biosynthesis protein PslG